MAEATGVARFRFLYRAGEGVIDRATWVRASLPPVAIALVLTFVWLRRSRRTQAARSRAARRCSIRCVDRACTSISSSMPSR